MSKQKPVFNHSVLLRGAVGLLVLIAAAYVVGRNWHTVQASLQVARHASIRWLVLSLLLMAFTFAVAAAIYGVLALHRLRYRQTVLVEVAASFVNRLLPSGLGGLGLHGIYLYRRKHTGAEATVVVSVNNLLGMAAHVLLLACLLVLDPSVLHGVKTSGHSVPSWWLAVAAALLLAVVYGVPPLRRRVASFVRHLLVSVRKLSLRKLAVALMLAMLLTATYTLILFAASRSLGLHLGVLKLFLVFSLGMLTSTATPTPGGLVGAEAGLFAGFVAYGVSSPQAGAAVLLYRLVTYWLPLAPGAAALYAARHRLLV